MLTGLTSGFENAPSGVHIEFVTPQEALDEVLKNPFAFHYTCICCMMIIVASEFILHELTILVPNNEQEVHQYPVLLLSIK